jgi:DmsE family decaheme c-type cytochrome
MDRGRYEMLRGRRVAVGVSAVVIAGGGMLFASCMLGDRVASVTPEVVAHKVMNAHAVGSEACAQCHDGEPAFYKKGYHRMAFFEKGINAGCESCHGLGSAHADNRENDKEVDDIVNPTDMHALSAADRSATCLGCHQDDFPLWPTTDHALHQVSCWDCHSSDLHQPPPDIAGSGYKPAELHAKQDDTFCLQCHEDVRSEFNLQYHHPVLEGQMRCADCHSIHGEPRKNPALQDTNAACISCHADTGGPWVFEHPALEEGCNVCHQPHGSVNNKLLQTVDNSLCIKCHFEQPTGIFGRQPHAQFLQNGALCYDCHFQVHGSNTDRNLNPRRYR